MLPASLALCVWLPAILGFGSFAPAGGGPLRRAGTAGAVGLAVLAAIAVALHLVVPLSPAVSVAALIVGWTLFARARPTLLDGVRARHAAFVLGTIVALAALTQLPARHYDTGLYFLQSVRWNREHEQVAGLASLHPRLGYNSSWFALAAILEAPGLVGRSSFFLDALPTLFAACFAADAIGRLRSGDRRASTFYFALATFAAAYGADTLGSVYPDQPVAILTVLSLGAWLCALEEPDALVRAAVPGAILAAFAFTAKVSSVVLLMGWIAFLVWRRSALDGRTRGWLIAGFGAVLLPWAVRGVLASGCFLFPVASSCVPSLPWATPLPLVAEIDAAIRGWARWPGAPVAQALGGWGWLAEWLPQTIRLPHVGIPLAGLALGALAMRGRLLRSAVRGPLLVALAGVAFWFVTAPSPRFGVAYLLPAGMLATSGWAAEAVTRSRPSRLRVAALLTVVAAFFYLQWSVRPLRKVRPDTFALARWPAFPVAQVQRRVTTAGTEVSVPVGGDQCWDAAPPCTPWWAPGLVWTGERFLVSEGRHAVR